MTDFEYNHSEKDKYKKQLGRLPITYGRYHLTLLESDFKYFISNNHRPDWTHIMSVVSFNMRLFRMAYDYSIKDITILMGSAYALHTDHYHRKEEGLIFPHVNDIYILSHIYDIEPDEFFVDRINIGNIDLDYEDLDPYQ